jgi:hypothetical protein
MAESERPAQGAQNGDDCIGIFVKTGTSHGEAEERKRRRFGSADAGNGAEQICSGAIKVSDDGGACS